MASFVAFAKGGMDHRGLLEHNGALYRVGGMNNQQQVISDVTGYEVTK
ncbi:hypothetical protein ACOBV8_21955 (plasmid) [Pseudoalteromonas espejiana]